MFLEYCTVFLIKQILILYSNPFPIQPSICCTFSCCCALNDGFIHFSTTSEFFSWSACWTIVSFNTHSPVWFPIIYIERHLWPPVPKYFGIWLCCSLLQASILQSSVHSASIKKSMSIKNTQHVAGSGCIVLHPVSLLSVFLKVSLLVLSSKPFL